MAQGHVHSVRLDNGNYYHLFNLMFMGQDEINVLKLCLSGRPIPQELLAASQNVKKSIDEIINMSIVKNTQPAAERIEDGNIDSDVKDVEVIKDDDVEEDKEEA